MDSFWMPEGASTVAAEVDGLFYFVTWASAVLFAGVIGAMIYLAVRYRRRHEREVPEIVVPNKLIEISWIVVPTILVLILFNWGFKLYIKMGIAPPDSYEIVVRGSQWKWDFEYPDGTTTTNEVHVPIDRPVRFKMSSIDVLHSLFVPAFRVKQDVLPDRYTYIWFQATKQDTFQVYCTEYCGTAHSGMLASLVAESQDKFETWLKSAGAAEDVPLPQLGANLYEQQMCIQCHTIDGNPGIGPTFQGLYGKTETMDDGSTVQVDDNYLRESILEPGAKVVQGYQNIMPAAYGSMNERQIAGLIAFIQEQSQ